MSLTALEGGNTSPRKRQQTIKTIKSKEPRTTISKKLVEIGQKQYIDAETGEVRDFNVVSMEEKDFNFQKLWLGHILEAIQEMGNAKMKVLMYLIENRNKSNNAIIKTAEKMAKEIGITRQTVSQTLKILEEHNIIKRVTGAVYLNPDVIFKGGKHKRMNVLLEYHSVDDDEEELEPLEEAINHQNKKDNRQELLRKKAEIEAELEQLSDDHEDDEEE